MTTSTHFIPSESALELLCGVDQKHSWLNAALHDAWNFVQSIVGLDIISSTPDMAIFGKHRPAYYGAHLDENGCGGAPGFTRVPPTRRERNARCLERVYPVAADQIRNEPEPFFGKLVFVNGAELAYVPANIVIQHGEPQTIATSVRAYLLPNYFSFETHLGDYDHATRIANAPPHPIANSSHVAFPTPVWMMGRLSEGFGRHGPLDSSPLSEPQLTLYAYGIAFETEKTLRDPNYAASRRQ